MAQIEEYTGSNAWAGFGMAGFGTDLLSNYMQLQSTQSEAAALKFKAERSRISGEAALMQTKLNNAVLQERYNENAANQAVEIAMQGRTGATVANIIAKDKQQLNWDQRFMELSGIITKAGYDIDAAGYRKAAAEKIQTGYKQSALGLLGSAAKLAMVV